MKNQALDALLMMEGATTRSELRDGLSALTSTLGMTSYIFGISVSSLTSTSVKIVLTNFNRTVLQKYVDSAERESNPIIMRTFKERGTFWWDGMFKSEKELQMYQELRRYGYATGVSSSEGGPSGALAMLTFAGKSWSSDLDQRLIEGTTSIALSTARRRAWEIIKSDYKEKLNRMPYMQRMVLRHMTAGQSAVDAGRILGVSADAVRYHLDKAVDSFSLSSRSDILKLFGTLKIDMIDDIERIATSMVVELIQSQL